jgi:hypothetical protein
MKAARNRQLVTLATAACLVLLLGAPIGAGAADGGVPGAYLRFGASARSLALGNAVTGMVDDVATSYWNPSGLARLRTMELTGMGATLFEDTRYAFFALGMPTESWGTFALGATIVRSGNFERASLFDDLSETFTEQEGVFSISYANGGGRFSYGATLKHVSQQIAGNKGSGTGADIGIYFRPHRNISFGAAIQNVLTPKITLAEDEEELVRSARAGLALRFFNNRLLMMTDFVETQYMDTSFRTGLEVWPTRGIAMRGGWDSDREQWSVGTGLRWENWQFDYAFIDTDLGAKNVLSATLRFGVPYGVKVARDRALFSPSGTDRDVTFSIDTAIRDEVESWRLEIRDEQDRVVSTKEGNGKPPEGVTWAGDDTEGRLVSDGTYVARMVILDDLGQEWEYETDVEVLGFKDRTRVPIKVQISGSGDDSGAAGGNER